VRRVRLLLLLPPLRACPPHRAARCARARKQGRVPTEPVPGGSSVLLPFMWHVHCACFNGLWGRGGLPLTGWRGASAALVHLPSTRSRAGARYARRISGKGLGGGAGRRPWRGSDQSLPVCDAWRSAYLDRCVHLYATRCAR
jgi:hypothetical protein